LLARTGRVLRQQTKDKHKLSELHTSEVDCISKGKARVPDEFGVKVSVATTLNEGLVVGMRSMPVNPNDGRTLAETLKQVGILAESPLTTILGRGNRGVQVDGVRILPSGQRRGITRT
jgi:IS5 family transposase